MIRQILKLLKESSEKGSSGKNVPIGEVMIVSQFYKQSAEETMATLGVTIQGLIDTEIAVRRREQGFNELIETNRKTHIEVFFDQFKDFLVLILIGAATISAFLGKWESALVIVTVIFLNAVLGTIQHIKTEQSLDSLKALSSPKAKVMRNGQKIEIASK